MIRGSSLDEQPTFGPPTTDGSCRPDQQPHGLLSRPISRGVQLLIEIEKHHNICVDPAVQGGLGPEQQVVPGGDLVLLFGADFGDRPIDKQGELLGGSGDAEP